MADPQSPPHTSHASHVLPARRGYCLCCQMDRAYMHSLCAQLAQLCRVCILHQDDDRGGWAKRDQHHRQMWAGELAEAEEAYLDELATLEVEVARLRGVLHAADLVAAESAIALARIGQLRAQAITNGPVVAGILTTEGIRAPGGDPWDAAMVEQLAGRSTTAC